MEEGTTHLEFQSFLWVHLHYMINKNNCNTQIFQSVIESNNTFKGGSFIHIRLNCIYNVIYSKSWQNMRNPDRQIQTSKNIYVLMDRWILI